MEIAVLTFFAGAFFAGAFFAVCDILKGKKQENKSKNAEKSDFDAETEYQAILNYTGDEK